MENENIISENRIKTNFRFHGYSLNLGYGLRVDSANDLSVNLSMHRYKTISAFQNEYAYPTPVNNQNDEHINSGGEINLSYIHRKSKFITKSIVAKAKIENIEYNNRLAYMQPQKNDSISRQFQTKPMNWIVEYNYLNTRHETYNIEYGLQFYQKDYSQGFYVYTLNSLNNENLNLIYSQKDSLQLNQYAIKSYFKYDKDFTSKKNIVLSFSSELYSIHPNNFKRKNYCLPDIDVSYKTLFNNNASLKYSLYFYFSKPSEDYFTGQQYYNNPAETRRGSADLAPGKTIGAGIEYILLKKATFSTEFYGWHSFDDPTFFTAYDSIKKLMVTSPNNGDKSYGIGYKLNFQKLIAKKLNLSIYSSIYYLKRTNRIINTSSSGLRYRIQPTITYFLGRKYGNLNFWGIIEGNNVTSQGKTTGPLRYSLSYAKSIIQRKFTVVFILDEFLVKNREKKTYSVFNGLSQYSNIIRPSRLISIRFAYYFSNIRLSKFAKMKSASIKGERKAD
ncbi:MAG: outer membrane beta-barrel protein [Niastella sp.]|nr:outer membrane beta-barrel protein [Niastella sp.]